MNTILEKTLGTKWRAVCRNRSVYWLKKRIKTPNRNKTSNNTYFIKMWVKQERTFFFVFSPKTVNGLQESQNSPPYMGPLFGRYEVYEVSSGSRADRSWQNAAQWDGLSLTICVHQGFSSWPDLKLSDIQHNHSRHVRADSTWESSQNSSCRESHSLVPFLCM